MNETRQCDVDVMIIGGGPAGTSTALSLARAGRKTFVAEHTSYDTIRIGETLPPRAQPLLSVLGLPASLRNHGHLEAPGIVTAWGSPHPQCNDFIVNPYGHGWHLDRPQFDRMLAAHARDRGVTVEERTTVTACDPIDEGWRIGLQNAAGFATMTCRFVVDATGRRASPLKRRASCRIIHDRLIGIAAFTPCSAGSDRRTLIEATSDGWWYSALLPGNQHVAIYMTDADTIDSRCNGLAGFVQRQLRHAPLTLAHCSGNLLDTARVVPVAAMTCHRTLVYGRNWLLAGDAAMTWDPLSGQGICKALESGIRAARAIERALDEDTLGLDDYAQWTQTQFGDYLRTRTRYYRSEQRWPNSPFWRRRHDLN